VDNGPAVMRNVLLAANSPLWRMEALAAVVAADVSWSRCNFAKYFWACDRIWAELLVGIRKATFFHSLPHSVSPSRKAWCSSWVHRPVDFPLGFCDEDERVLSDPLRFLLLLDSLFGLLSAFCCGLI